MINLYSLSPDDLNALFAVWGEPRYRVDQVWQWLYERRAATFADMTNLPKALRTRLEAEATLGSLDLATEQESTDGTIKRVYRLEDDQLIESVLMEYDDERRTACISTQAGCAMGCVFCATGRWVSLGT